jgi:hypothetical protein
LEFKNISQRKIKLQIETGEKEVGKRIIYMCAKNSPRTTAKLINAGDRKNGLLTSIFIGQGRPFQVFNGYPIISAQGVTQVLDYGSARRQLVEV